MVWNMERENKFSSLDIKEKERQRIARDLHDVTLQNLSHLIHKVELTSLYMEKDIVKAKLELATIEKEIRHVIDDTRTIIYNLHPVTLDDLGLKATIEKIINVANKNYKFFIETDIEDVSCENKILQITILRLIQECCHNALKHSNGNKLYVSVKLENDKYILRISDNGKGFNEEEVDKKESHFGLCIMKERIDLLNGKMKIDSSDNGTSIVIEIPSQLDEYNDIL